MLAHAGNGGHRKPVIGRVSDEDVETMLVKDSRNILGFFVLTAQARSNCLLDRLGKFVPLFSPVLIGRVGCHAEGDRVSAMLNVENLLVWFTIGRVHHEDDALPPDCSARIAKFDSSIHVWQLLVSTIV